RGAGRERRCAAAAWESQSRPEIRQSLLQRRAPEHGPTRISENRVTIAVCGRAHRFRFRFHPERGRFPARCSASRHLPFQRLLTRAMSDLIVSISLLMCSTDSLGTNSAAANFFFPIIASTPATMNSTTVTMIDVDLAGML